MRALIFLLTLMAGAMPSIASEAVNLQQSVDLALRHAPMLQAAQAARDAAQESINLGQAQLLPSLSLSASLMRKHQDFNYQQPAAFLRPAVRNTEKAYGIQAYQPLFDLSKWANYQQGELLAENSALQLEAERQQTILQTAAAWLDQIRAQAVLDAATSSEKAMQKLARQAELSFEIGMASVNDSFAAQSRHDLSTSARIRAEQAVWQAKAQLDSLLGRDSSVQTHIQPHTHPLTITPDSLEAWQSIAENHALGIQRYEQAVAMADNQHMQALGTAMPKVQLVAGWNQTNSSDGSFGGSTVKSSIIGVELNAPLYAGGALSAKRRQTTQAKVQAEYNVAEAKRTTRLNIQQAWLGLQSTASEMRAMQTALTSAASAQHAAAVGFEVGLRTITDLMDADERIASAKQGYADAWVRHAMAFLQLYAAAGTLDHKPLQLIDERMR